MRGPNVPNGKINTPDKPGLPYDLDFKEYDRALLDQVERYIAAGNSASSLAEGASLSPCSPQLLQEVFLYRERVQCGGKAAGFLRD